MEQAKIVLTRVDNRLVHGQVGSTWTNSIGVDTIVVVDDDVAIN
ncbi:MAG: PTS sugar transporter subunit IIB, partial [Erysipelotrichaceae bacterium]